MKSQKTRYRSRSLSNFSITGSSIGFAVDSCKKLNKNGFKTAYH